MVNGLRKTRIGAIGARPAAFNTVRYSEKLLEASGIDVETVDLSEILGRIGRMKDGDPAAQDKLKAIKSYVSTQGIPEESLMKMAKLGAVVEGWMRETAVTVSAVQCWTAIEEYYGVVPCTIMSMMSDTLMPAPAKWTYVARWRCRPSPLPPEHRAPCSIGTTITEKTRIRPSASTAVIFQSTSSSRCAWIFRRSLRARSVRQALSEPLWDG